MKTDTNNQCHHRYHFDKWDIEAALAAYARSKGHDVDTPVHKMSVHSGGLRQDPSITLNYHHLVGQSGGCEERWDAVRDTLNQLPRSSTDLHDLADRMAKMLTPAASEEPAADGHTKAGLTYVSWLIRCFENGGIPDDIIAVRDDKRRWESGNKMIIWSVKDHVT